MQKIALLIYNLCLKTMTSIAEGTLPLQASDNLYIPQILVYTKS